MKKVMIIALVVAVLAIIAVVIIRFNLSSTAEQPELPPTVTLNKDIDMALGTKENPLTILEIVPCLDRAEFGYLISGCEPIDLERLSMSEDTSIYASFWGGEYGVAAVSAQSVEGSGVADELSPGSVVDSSSWDETAKSVAEEEMESYDTYGQFEIEHNNDLIKLVFGEDVDPDNVVSRVITLTPYDFRNPDNINLIAQVDMIYMHSGHSPQQGGLIDLWTKYNKEGTVLTEEEKARDSFEANDLPWDAVLAIVDRMTGENPAAFLADATVYNNMTLSGQYNTSANNCHKLMLMLKQYGPKVFKEAFLDAGKIIESETLGNGLTTGVYLNEAASYIEWGEDTFWPDIPDHSTEYLIEAGMKCPDFTSDWTTMADGIYCFSGNDDMTGNFTNVYLSETDSNGEAFDYFEELYGHRPDKLSTLQIVKYLLEDSNTKRQLKILEVEPCNKFIYGSEGWEVYYLSLFPWFEGKLKEDVTVVTMPAWQFISSIEDLNSEYDAIIFGTNQDVSNGLNGYRDPLLNYKDGNEDRGLRYISIGDLVTDETSEVGGVTQDKSARYSGNDITQKKLEELKEFLNAGRPIILDRSFLNRNKQVDTEKIVDKSSYMYQLVSMYGQDVEGVNTDGIFVKGLYQAHKLKKAVAFETCKIQFQGTQNNPGYPTEYEYVPAEDGTITNVSYASGKLEYTFNIAGKMGQKYGIDLFIDANGDGIYEGSKKEKTNNVGSEIVSGIVVRDETGKQVDPHELYADVTYTLSKTLEDNYQGILPWKLEAYKIDNENCRNSVVKYSAVRASANSKEKIRVLLMQPTADMSDPAMFYGAYDNRSHALDSMFWLEQLDQLKKYLACVDEFDITLEYLSNSEWCSNFGAADAGSESAMADEWKQYLNHYDMLILGFGDDCTFTSNKVYYEGFMYFVNQGKSVILSHDMAYDKSQEEEAVLPAVSDNATRQYVLSGDANKADRDAYANPGSAMWENAAGDCVTQYVNIINEGQITNYPYAIPDVIVVADTHAQNYQLNMEDEDIVVWYGLTDKYTKNYQTQMQELLGSSYDEEIVSPDRVGRGVYSSIESDGRNSFYIYNRGNVTYTGLGHGGNMTDDEARLFVNTMIAAYRAAPAVPFLEITNEDAVYNDDEIIIYVTMDEANFNTDHEFLDVHFELTDPSEEAVENRQYILRYYDKDNNIMQAADETGVVGCQKTYTGATADVLPAMEDSDLVYVMPGGEYYFRVPYQKIKDEGSTEYNLTLTSNYVNASQQSVETISRTKVVIMPMPLFTLN